MITNSLNYHSNIFEHFIESHLLEAMLKFGILTEEQYKDTYTFYFQRAARTDRGVSAVRQVANLLRRIAFFAM